MLPLLLACVLNAAVPVGEPQRVTTAHYDLEWAGTKAEADDAARTLEIAFDELTTFFAAKPEDRLRVRVFRDEESRLGAAWNDGITVPEQSKFASFSDVTRTTYVARLDTPAATRRGLLYATCLQFHALCKSKNLDITRTWYSPGLALDFARSTWDGVRLKAFAAPLVEPVDLPGRALALLGPDESNPTWLKSLQGDVPIAPELAWGAVAMCLHGSSKTYKAAFQRYALGDTGTKLSSEDFMRTLGPAKTVAKDLRAFLLASQTPFEALGDWEDRGDAGLRGRTQAQQSSFCVLREGTQRLGALMKALPRTSASAGFVAGWFGPEDHARIDVEAPEVLIRVTRLGKVQSSMRLPIAGDAGKDRRIELAREGNQYVLKVDDVLHGPIELPSGRMGFFVSGSEATFRDVTWR